MIGRTSSRVGNVERPQRINAFSMLDAPRLAGHPRCRRPLRAMSCRMRRGEHAARQALRSSPARTWLVMHRVFARTTRPPLAHDGCEKKSSHRAKRPMRSAAADGVTSTLPLVAPTMAPLSVNPNVIGDADAAPRHGHRRAARERAGMPGRSAFAGKLRRDRPVTGERYAAIAVA